MTDHQTSISLKEEAFHAAIAQIAAEDLKRQRFAQILTALMVIAAGAWLAFAAFQVRELHRKSLDLVATQAQLSAQISKDQEILVALNPLLENFGWASDKIPHDFADVDRIRRSVEADDELSRLRLSAHPPRAWNTKVLYYRKDIDGSKVATALSDFGFQFEQEKPLVEDIPCNDVVFGNDTSPEDAKIVAYVLIRAGIDIKGIHHSNLLSKSGVIQVIGNRIVADGPALTVDQISKMSSFAPDPMYPDH